MFDEKIDKRLVNAYSIQDCVTELYKNSTGSEREAYRNTLDIICNADTECEWVSIDEERPTLFGYYLTYNAKTKQMMVLSYSPEYCTFGIYDTEVTHWMPIPVNPPER